MLKLVEAKTKALKCSVRQNTEILSVKPSGTFKGRLK